MLPSRGRERIVLDDVVCRFLEAVVTIEGKWKEGERVNKARSFQAGRTETGY